MFPGVSIELTLILLLGTAGDVTVENPVDPSMTKTCWLLLVSKFMFYSLDSQWEPNASPVAQANSPANQMS